MFLFVLIIRYTKLYFSFRVYFLIILWKICLANVLEFLPVLCHVNFLVSKTSFPIPQVDGVYLNDICRVFSCEFFIIGSSIWIWFLSRAWIPLFFFSLLDSTAWIISSESFQVPDHFPVVCLFSAWVFKMKWQDLYSLSPIASHLPWGFSQIHLFFHL